jgi:hypothetical protein
MAWNKLFITAFTIGIVPLLQSPSASAPQGGNLIRQTSDLTCGPAAVATLLKFYFGENTTEDEIAKLAGTYEKRTSSLLDLRNACRAKGYQAAGYRMTLPQLIREAETSGVPVIVHFKEPTLHFALVVGQAGEFILASDPSLGNVSIDVKDFLRRWDNHVLVVKSSRPVNREIAEKRKRSAEKRLKSLNRANLLMSSTRY